MRRSLLALFAILVVAAPLLAGCGGSDSVYNPPIPPVDNAPVVALTAPLAGQTLAGMVQLAANATDDKGVVQVEFFVEGVSVGIDDTAPYSMMWDSTGTLFGDRTIEAVATDTADQTDDDSRVSLVFQGHDPYFAANPYADTDSCLTCHMDVGNDLIQTGHWLWEGDNNNVEGFEGQLIGKTNLINNFCIAIGSNEARCTQCHIGIGWKANPTGDPALDFDFDDPSGLDCLVCHDTTNTYAKDPKKAGAPVDTVDLNAVAQSVGTPTRRACLPCHANAGGGDNVKHGDIAMNLLDTTRVYDVHMGTDGGDFACQRCHEFVDHGVGGMPIHHVDEGNMQGCQDCHPNPNHTNGIVGSHTTLACQVCHIPAIARFVPTKVEWYWETAGDGARVPVLDENGKPDYDKMKGDFVWEKNYRPALRRFDGKWNRTFVGNDDFLQPADKENPVVLGAPAADGNDKSIKIYPFKKMIGNQPADRGTLTVVVPHLFPYNADDTTAYWKSYEWGPALLEGARYNDQPKFSNDIQWIYTVMYLTVNHEVAPKEQALGSGGCADCHASGLIDWEEIGYPQGNPLPLGN